jgi:hypothetical protein
MISNLDYEFSAGDAEARARARIRYLRDSVQSVRRAVQGVKASDVDGALLDVFLLQPTFLRFCRHDRGYVLPDEDMREKVIGPLGALLHAFDALRSLNLDEIEERLAVCEAKVGRQEAVTR